MKDDLISRAAAIDALARMMPRSYTPDGSHPADEEIFRAQEVFADCIEALEILPSAQPEIIRCKDCKWYRKGVHLSPNKFCYRLKDNSGKRIGYNFADDDFCSYAERRTDA